MKLPDCCERTLKTDGASCVFGCGTVIDDDTQMCPTCRDHSANRFECETCGRVWEKWSDEWELESHAPDERCDCPACLAAHGTYKVGHSGGLAFWRGCRWFHAFQRHCSL